MCSCSHCRNLLALGLVVGVVVLHEPPHAHVPTPGEQEVALGSVAIVRSSSSSSGSVLAPANQNLIHVVHAVSRAQHEAATYTAIRQTLHNNRIRV